MFRWIQRALQRGREKERAEGRAWALEQLRTRSAQEVRHHLYLDFAVGWPRNHWTDAAFQTIEEAEQHATS